MQVLESSGRPASPAEESTNRETRAGDPAPRDDAVLLIDMDASHARVCAEQRRLFTFIAEADRRSLWESDGAHDMAHWLRMRYGVSDWKARRWIASAHALESLPLTSEAFASGRLGVDKVVELTRFATPETEQKLLPWAERVASGTIREKGNELARRSVQENQELEADRSFDWWHDPDGRSLQFEGRLPSAEGRVVVNAVERMMRRLPVVPEKESPSPEQRRADALVAICSARWPPIPTPTGPRWWSTCRCRSCGGKEWDTAGTCRPQTQCPMCASRDVPCREEASSPTQRHGAWPVTAGSRRSSPAGTAG
jgi:Domain of unknown function (DUF222)